MRTRLAALLVALGTIAAVTSISGSAATGQPLTEQPFSGHGTASAIGANALNLGNTVVANVQAAHSAGSVNSGGLSTPIVDELGQNVQPAIPDKNGYGRGAGAEVGLVTGSIQNVDVNQIILNQLAEATSPPPSPLVVKDIPIDLSPLLKATTTHGEAQSKFDPNFCAIGKPLTYGASFIENLEVLNPGSALIASNLGPDRVSSSRTLTYLIPNGDGTFGMVTEERIHIAPISLVNNALTGIPAVSIEIAGDFVFRAIATGKPGGAKIEYPGTPVLTVKLAGVALPPTPITLQNLLGTGGLVLPLGPIGTITLGSPPHQIGGTPLSAPQIATDGTSAAAAVDAVRLSILQLAGLNGLDLRLGHFEAAAQVPPGGIKCNIPVSKTGTPDPITAGQDFTITIRIPSDSAIFEDLIGCDLIGIKAVDVHTVDSGSATFVLTGADHGGTIGSDGSTVTFTNLGDYHIGDPPIELHVFGRVPGSSGAGVLKDTVTVDASLGNCHGTGAGDDIVGTAIGQITNRAVTGTFTLIGPDVSRSGVLAATGGDGRLLVLGGALLLGAFAVRRRLRKPAGTT